MPPIENNVLIKFRFYCQDRSITNPVAKNTAITQYHVFKNFECLYFDERDSNKAAINGGTAIGR